MGQSFSITIFPSFSRMVALISPTFSFKRTETSFLPSRMSCRASRTQFGQSESVCRGHPRGGFVFWYDFSSGLSDHRGVNEGFCLILLATEKTCQTPLAATDNPFSTYFIGACIAYLLTHQAQPWALGGGGSSPRAPRAETGPETGPIREIVGDAREESIEFPAGGQ